MSDDRDRQSGQSARLLRTLIWAGVGLAPVAAVVVLIGGGENSVRFAVVLIAVCVVLIGTSILIRSDPVLLGMDTEDRIAAAAEAVRTELRAELAAAARATHHRVQSLQDEVGHLRGAPASARPEPRLATGARAVAVVPPVVASASADPPPKSGYAETGGRPAPALAGPGRAVGGGRSAAPGIPAGGRATVTPSAPGWPETEQPPRRNGQVTGRRAAVSAGAAVPPAHLVAASVPVPRQRGAAGVPPMAPDQGTRPGAPRPGQYGSPHRGDGDLSSAAQLGWSADKPSYGGQPGWDDRGDRSWPDPEDHSFWTDPDGQTGRPDDDGPAAEPGRWTGDEPSHGHQLERPVDEPSYGGQPGPRPPAPGPIYGRAESHWADDDPSYGGQPDWGSQPDQPGQEGHDHLPGWRGQTGWSGDDQAGEDARPAWPDEPNDTPDRPHKRRADVTAVDLGYTGRRSRPGHARPDSR